MKTFIGIVLIAAGIFFAVSGYQLRQSFRAQAERGLSNTLESITSNEASLDEQTNTEANIKLIGGGLGVLVGAVLVVRGIKK